MNIPLRSNYPKKIKSTNYLSLEKNNQGETIVEVLVAMAIIGFVFAVAVAGANRSSIFIRQSQERNEALEIVEQQVEQLYAMNPSDYEDILDNTSEAFCLDDTNSVVEFASATPPANYWEDALSDTTYPDECIDGRYHTHILKDTDPSAPEGSLLFRSRWIRLGSDDIDEVQIVWRRNLVEGYPSPALLDPSNPTDPVSPVVGTCNTITISIEDQPGTPDLKVGSNTSIKFPLSSTVTDDCLYDVRLTGIEVRHAQTETVARSQVQERFFVVGLDNDDNETFVTNPTDDIPECDDPPIDPSDPNYGDCTEVATYEGGLEIPAGTSHIEFRHIILWDDDLAISFGKDPCPPGAPNNACDGAIEATENVNSLHGFRFEATPQP